MTRAPKPQPPCGTVSGYRGHKYRGQPICEPCRAAYNRYQCDYRSEKPELFSRYEATRAPGRTMLRPQDVRRDDHLKSRYGINLVQKAEIFDWQDRACLCCTTTVEHDRATPWQVEHDHDTQQLRGVVCSRCNRLIAQCGDTAYGVAIAASRMLAYMHGCGQGLSDEQLEALIAALRSRRSLQGIDEAHADRAPQPRHEAA